MEYRGIAIALSLGSIGLSLSLLLNAPEMTKVNFGDVYPFLKGLASFLIGAGCLVLPFSVTRFRILGILGTSIIIGTIAISFILGKLTGYSIGTTGWVSAFVGILFFIPAGILCCVISGVVSLADILEKEAAARTPVMITFGVIALFFAGFYLIASKTPDIAPLLERLKYPEKSYRHFSAASDLSEIDNPDMLEPLLVLLRDSNPETRTAAALALGGKSREAKAIAPLLEALENETNLEASEWMIRTLGTTAPLADEKQRIHVVAVLIRFLTGENQSLKDTAAQSLGVIGDERAIPPLIDALQDEDTTFDAHNALIQITGQHLSSNPDEWSTWWQHTSSSQQKTP